jgi:hypothetical protein
MEPIKTRYDEPRAKRLMNSLTANPRARGSGELTNDLLSEFHRGYPLEHLKPMLHSADTDLVKAGAWIASELGKMGKPLLDEVASLLEHPDSRVRFYTIDCVLLWADSSQSALLARVVRLIEDPEHGVRWKAMEFLSRASSEQLFAALNNLQVGDPNSKFLPGLRLLIDPGPDKPSEATVALHDEDGLMRKFGAVLPRRIIDISRDPLLCAASIADAEVKDFADKSISLL